MVPRTSRYSDFFKMYNCKDNEQLPFTEKELAFHSARDLNIENRAVNIYSLDSSVNSQVVH